MNFLCSGPGQAALHTSLDCTSLLPRPSRRHGGAVAVVLPWGPCGHKAVLTAEPRVLALYVWEMCWSLGERSVLGLWGFSGGGVVVVLFSPEDARPVAKWLGTSRGDPCTPWPRRRAACFGHLVSCSCVGESLK